jgi:hypothetical protein
MAELLHASDRRTDRHTEIVTWLIFVILFANTAKHFKVI